MLVRSASAIVLAALLMVPGGVARATDCSGVILYDPPPTAAGVRGRILSVEWTDRPLPLPNCSRELGAFARVLCLQGNPGLADAVLTMEVMQRWNTDGSPAAPGPPQTLRGPVQRWQPCGPDLAAGQVRGFHGTVQGSQFLIDREFTIDPALLPASPRKGAGCAGCATGDQDALPALVFLLAAIMGAARRRRRTVRR